MDDPDISLVNPPAGVSSNFIGPELKARVFMVTSDVFLALMLVPVANENVV